MHRLLPIAGLIALTIAQASHAAKARELIIDIPSALAPAGYSVAALSPATISKAEADAPNELEMAARSSPKEFLSRVRVGSWRWENGTALQLTGDRFKLSYGEKTRLNLIVKPFKDDGTINLFINRGF